MPTRTGARGIRMPVSVKLRFRRTGDGADVPPTSGKARSVWEGMAEGMAEPYYGQAGKKPRSSPSI